VTGVGGGREEELDESQYSDEDEDIDLSTRIMFLPNANVFMTKSCDCPICKLYCSF
jgi:hypothetical protein